MEERKNLTKDEIEFLLGGASRLSGKEKPPFPIEASKMKVGPFPAMDEIFERVSDVLSYRFCELLGRSTTVKYTGMELERVGDTLRCLPPTSLHTLKIRIGSSTWIAYLAEGRDMGNIIKTKVGLDGQTILLKMVREKMMEMLLDTLQKGWSTIHPLSIEKLEESSSTPLQHYGKDTPFLIPQFQLKVEGAASEVTLLIPLFAITSMGRAAKRREALEPQGALVPNEKVLAFLELLDVEITFTLGRKKTTLKEIMNLKPGSTIVLTESKENQVYIELNKKNVFICRRISGEGGKLKFQVEKEIT